MPTRLNDSFNIKHKGFKLTALLLLSPLFFFAQSLTGLWTGVLTNDSNSVRKDQSFEIALTEYRGKVYGYSRSEFIVNDTLYYIVKRVKGSINGDTCEVIDDDIISFNFPKKIDKGVKVYSTFYRNKKDSTWYLAGTWKTNKTKKYYSVTGKVDMKEEKDLSASKIFPHLEELNLANDVAFYRDRKKGTDSYLVKTIEPEKKNTEPVIKDTVAFVKNGTDPQTEETKLLPASSIENIPIRNKLQKPGEIDPIVQTITNKQSEQIKTIPLSPIQSSLINNESKQDFVTGTPKKDDAIASVDVKHEPEKQVEVIKKDEIKSSPTTLAGDIAKNNDNKNKEPLSQINKNNVTTIKTEQSQMNKAAVTDNNKPNVSTVSKATTTVAPSSMKQTDAGIKKNENILASANNNISVPVSSVIENKEIKNQPSVITILDKKDLAEASTAATFIKERKSEFSQIVNFKSDSLDLALYDNGEIDGDTVSVLLNGEVIIAKQCLKATAYKKTIYITPGKDEEFTMVLYAENLGKYPPNTGLLVVHDGDDVYNVHFSADFHKNAGVIFRRKQ